MIHIEVVSLPDVDRRWSLVADRVAACLKKAPMEMGAGDIWTNVRSGHWLLMLAWNEAPGVIGVSVWRFAANGLFECVILAGEKLSYWLPALVGAAETIAKGHGCTGLVATGRPGLIREIKKHIPKVKAARVTYHWEFAPCPE